MNCAKDGDDVSLMERALVRIARRARRAGDVGCEIQDGRDDSNQEEKEVNGRDNENSCSTISLKATVPIISSMLRR